MVSTLYASLIPSPAQRGPARRAGPTFGLPERQESGVPLRLDIRAGDATSVNRAAWPKFRCARAWAGSDCGKSKRKCVPRLSCGVKAAGDHQPRDQQHVLQLPSGRIGEFAGGHVTIPEFDLPLGRFEPGPVAANSHVAPHFGAQRIAQVDQIQLVVVVRPAGPVARQRQRGETVGDLGGDCAAAPRPLLRPKTSPSSRLFDASRFAPCRPLEVTSPAAHNPGTVVRPSASTTAPPIM